MITKRNCFVRVIAYSIFFMNPFMLAHAAQTLNLYTANASKNTAVEVLESVAKDISSRTQGQLKVRIHLGGSLQIQAPDITMAVGEAVVQIGDDQQFTSATPTSGILRLPGLIRNDEEYEKANAIVHPYVEKEYAKFGVSVLGTYYYHPMTIFSARKKITKLEDIKGVKIRSLSAESAEWVRRLGGIPITLSFAELAPALDNGTVDATMTNPTGAAYPLRDQLNSHFQIPIAYAQVYEIINIDTLDSLSAEHRKIVTEAFSKATGALTLQIHMADKVLLDKMHDLGMVTTSPSSEDLAKSESMMVSYWDEWAKERGPTTQQALGKVRKALGR